jgi:azurin
MKMRILAVSVLTALVAFATSGCGPNSSSPATEPTAPAGPRIIEISAGQGDKMQYNVASIEAKAGEDIKVVLTNEGTQPREVMGHNWVLLKLGADASAFAAAGIGAAATGYIPANLQDQILAKIDLLGPRKSGEVEFKAPTTPGEYTFLCTFPAHFQSGMKGVLVVK